MSRIDRIYLHKDNYIFSHVWAIERTGISDHDAATIDIIKKDLPYIGGGIWKLTNEINTYKPFRNKAKKLLKNAENEIQNYKTQIEGKQSPDE